MHELVDSCCIVLDAVHSSSLDQFQWTRREQRIRYFFVVLFHIVVVVGFFFSIVILVLSIIDALHKPKYCNYRELIMIIYIFYVSTHVRKEKMRNHPHIFFFFFDSICRKVRRTCCNATLVELLLV